jgi:hypothetical protein
MNPQVIDTLITKIGLTPVQAVWVMSLSEKHAVWIANQIKQSPELFPKEGGKFKKIMKWKKKNNAISLEGHTCDSLVKLMNTDMPFNIIEGSLKNQRIVAECEGGEYKWVAIKNKEECVEEGDKMHHCLRHGGQSYLRGAKLYSLRNKNNIPVLTLQIKGNAITEYRAKHDKEPNEIFAQYFKFLEQKEKLNIHTFSKFAHGITKEKQIFPKLFKGNLTIPSGAGKSVRMPVGFHVTGDFIMEDCNVKLPAKLKVGGNLVFNEYIHEGKITDVEVGKNIILNSIYVKLDMNNIKLKGMVIVE